MEEMLTVSSFIWKVSTDKMVGLLVGLLIISTALIVHGVLGKKNGGTAE